MSTRDISKAIRTATSALEAGNVATARRAMTYAAKRLGLAGCVASRMPEANLAFGLGLIIKACARRDAAASERSALFVRNGTWS